MPHIAVPARALRHSQLAQVRKTGLFNTALKGGFKEFEDGLARLRREGATTHLVGAVWEVFCEAFIWTDPEIQAEEVWPLNAAPAALLRKLRLPGKDIGCDGFLRRRSDGGVVAYQAKFSTDRLNPGWRNLGTFAGASGRADGMLVLTNADAISSTAAQRPGMRVCSGPHFRTYVDASRMARVRALVNHVPDPVPRREPAPHQEEALRDLMGEFLGADRATAVMACGTGKTLTALWCAERVGARDVVVFLPSLALIRQTLREWGAEHGWGEQYRFLAVCSDATVAEDEAQVSRADVSFPITTDPARIRAFLKKSGGVRVVFSTYHSASRLAEGMPKRFRFDFGVFDEAHKTAGLVDNGFGLALSDGGLEIHKRLFLTATPRTYSAKAVGEATLVNCMDDPRVYGRVAHRLSFGRAAELDIICRYKVVVSVVTRAEVAEALGGSAVLIDGERMPAEDVAAQIALAKAAEQYGARRIISFHQTVMAAQRFVSAGPTGVARHMARPFLTVSISGDMNVARREEVLDEFREAERGLVSNARCMTEGVDVPAVDMVAFMSRRRSHTDIVQAIGRAIRRPYGSNKDYGYVLVPLLVDEMAGESIEEAVKRADYREIYDVLRALMDQDEDLTDRINDLRRQSVNGGGFGVGGIEGYVAFVGAPGISLDAIRQAVTIRAVEYLASNFETAFAELEAFLAEFGHAWVPQGHRTSRGFNLGRWVTKQRALRRKGKLSEEREARIGRLPTWSWQPLDDYFELAFARLTAFVKRKGHALVPDAHVEEGFSLGAWVVAKRMEYRRGVLDSARVARLAEVPRWSWDPTEQRFSTGLWHLVRHVSSGAGKLVGTTMSIEGYRLGQWATVQRVNYRQGNLNADRVRLLEGVPGWRWEPNAERDAASLRALDAFVEREGHARVPSNHVEGLVGLGSWVERMRALRRRNDLPLELELRLGGLSGWTWEPRADFFEQGYQRLRDLCARTGSAYVHGSHMDEDAYALGRWAQDRRYQYKAGRLSADRVRKLEGLPGWRWEEVEDPFTRNHGLLLRFQAREGHCNVPQRHVEEEVHLGFWVNVCRRHHRDGIMPENRVRLLEGTPGWAWNAREDSFDRYAAAYRAFVRREGHGNVPRSHIEDGLALSTWVVGARARYQRGAMSKERLSQYEALPHWVWAVRDWDGLFEQGVAAFERFAREHGHGRVPVRHYQDGFKLGTWVNSRRTEYTRGKLSAERVERLKVTPHWLWRVQR